MTDQPSLSEAERAARAVGLEADRVALGERATETRRAEELDRGTQGQRRINLLWERTQAFIAVSVVATALVVAAVLILAPVLRGDPIGDQAVTGLVLLSALVSNVTTSYFTRTNHTKVGGVAPGDMGR